MTQLKIPAVFMRGGTSNAVVFHARDLPADRSQWDAIFLGAIGSPDPYGRQLDGMGGGVSSLSKVCVVGPSSRPDADIDYTFAQVQVKDARVDFDQQGFNEPKISITFDAKGTKQFADLTQKHVGERLVVEQPG